MTTSIYTNRIKRCSNLTETKVNQIVDSILEIESRPRNVSNRYSTISSLSLLADSLETLMEHNYHCEIVNVIKPGGKGTKHYLELHIPSLLNIDGGIIPRIYITNSYNGECSASVQIGLFRLVCSNGLMVGTQYFGMQVRHVIGDSIEEFNHSIPYVIPAAIDFIFNLGSKVTELKSITLNIPEQIQLVESLGMSDRITELVLKKLWNQANGFLRKEDTPRNLWTLFNIVNECVRRYSRKEFSNLQRNETLLAEIESAYQKRKVA